MSAGVPRLKDVVEELHEVKTKWRAIGIQLEVPLAALKTIWYAHKTDPEQAFADMTEEWLGQIEPEPSWSAIVDALRSRSVGEGHLASVIERKRCPSRAKHPMAPASGAGPGPNSSPESRPQDVTIPTLLTFPYITGGGQKVNIIERIASEYRKIGIILLNDVNGSVTKRIEMANFYNPMHAMEAMFEEWLQTDVDHSWRRLIQCLRACDMNTVAMDMEVALKQNGIIS